jgi:hypothetical protein
MLYKAKQSLDAGWAEAVASNPGPAGPDAGAGTDDALASPMISSLPVAERKLR